MMLTWYIQNIQTIKQDLNGYLIMKNIISILCAIVFLLFACSDNNDAQSKKDHVWKEQTNAIEKAKEVEGMVQESADEQRKLIEEQTQ